MLGGPFLVKARPRGVADFPGKGLPHALATLSALSKKFKNYQIFSNISKTN